MTQVNTFPLLWCEGCGRTQDPPLVRGADIIGATGPLRCGECNDRLMLLEAAIHDRSEMWQERRGSPWHHVVFLHGLENLPTTGRLWRLTGRDFAQMGASKEKGS